jgi:hypothetical protein
MCSHFPEKRCGKHLERAPCLNSHRQYRCSCKVWRSCTGGTRGTRQMEVSCALSSESARALQAKIRLDGLWQTMVDFPVFVMRSRYAVRLACRFHEGSDPNGFEPAFEISRCCVIPPQTCVRLRVRGENAIYALCMIRAELRSLTVRNVRKSAAAYLSVIPFHCELNRNADLPNCSRFESPRTDRPED